MAPITRADAADGDAGAEEVVGRRPDEHLVAPRLGDRGEHDRRVEVAVVVAGEDHRPVGQAGQPVDAVALGRAEGGHGRPHARPRARTSAGEPGGEPAGPVGVVVGAERARSARAPRRRRAPWGPSTGTAASGAAARTSHVTSAMTIGGLWRWVMVASRPDDVGGHLEGVVQRGRGREAEAPDRARLAADDDDLAEVGQAVAAPVPHVERVDAVVGVARAVEVAVPLVLGVLLLVAALDLDRVGGLGQHLLEEVDVARVVDRVELPRRGVAHDQHAALAHQRLARGTC